MREGGSLNLVVDSSLASLNSLGNKPLKLDGILFLGDICWGWWWSWWWWKWWWWLMVMMLMASFEQCYQYVSLHTISLRSPGAFDWSTLSQTFPPLEFLFTSKISSLAPHPNNSNICLENVEFCILAGKSSDANVFAEFLVTSAPCPVLCRWPAIPWEVPIYQNTPISLTHVRTFCENIYQTKTIFSKYFLNTSLKHQFKGFFYQLIKLHCWILCSIVYKSMQEWAWSLFISCT